MHHIATLSPLSSPAGLTSAFVPPPTAPIRAAAGPVRNPKIVERAAAFHIISGHRLIGGMGKDAVLALADHGVIDRADAREHPNDPDRSSQRIRRRDGLAAGGNEIRADGPPRAN